MLNRRSCYCHKKLAVIHDILVQPTIKLYTIFSKNDSVTLYQNHIFNSFQMHIVYFNQT